MPSYGVTIRDTASGTVSALSRELRDETYLPSIGEGAKLVLVEHLTEKNLQSGSHATASRLGARPIGLYADFARAANWQLVANGVLLSINHVAARARYEGVENMRPVNSTYLTIPAKAEVYGRRVRETGLSFDRMWGKDKDGQIRPIALIREGVKRDKSTGRVPDSAIYYWLVKSVSQKGDKTILPDDAEFIDGIREAIGDWFEGITGGRF